MTPDFIPGKPRDKHPSQERWLQPAARQLAASSLILPKLDIANVSGCLAPDIQPRDLHCGRCGSLPNFTLV